MEEEEEEQKKSLLLETEEGRHLNAVFIKNKTVIGSEER